MSSNVDEKKMEKDLENIPKESNVYCNRCKGYTNHESVWKSSREDAELDEEGTPATKTMQLPTLRRRRGAITSWGHKLGSGLNS